MTIQKFNEWGCKIARPSAIEFCDSDAEMAAVVDRYRRDQVAVPHIRLTDGSLANSLGIRQTFSETEVRELPIDLLHVTFRTVDGTQHCSVAVNSIVMRHRWWRGWIVAITNGGYINTWEIAPRAHPNDGLFDVVELDARMSYRQRLIARRRLRVGTHLPHPFIHHRQGRTEAWKFSSPMGLYLDEVHVGSITELRVIIEPDALKLVL